MGLSGPGTRFSLPVRFGWAQAGDATPRLLSSGHGPAQRPFVTRESTKCPLGTLGSSRAGGGPDSGRSREIRRLCGQYRFSWGSQRDPWPTDVKKCPPSATAQPRGSPRVWSSPGRVLAGGVGWGGWGTQLLASGFLVLHCRSPRESPGPGCQTGFGERVPLKPRLPLPFSRDD